MIRRRPLSPLGLRLAAAFVLVAVAAVAVLAALVVVATRQQVSELVTNVHVADAEAAAAAARAYESAGGWQGADLAGAVAVAASGQATLAVADAEGRLVAAPADQAAEMMTRMHGVAVVDVPRGDPVTAGVLVGGRRVGTVALRFPASHLPGPERQIRDALSRTAGLGALLAVAAAVAVAVFVAGRVTRPVTALTAAAAELEAGRRDVRVDLTDAPGELGVLAAAFDRMAAAVQREDELRRRLVHDVAHEVRTPLTILRGTTEALVDQVAEPDQATLASLHEEVLRLTRLVADLETLAAADAAGLQLGVQPLDLAELAGAAADLVRATAAEAGLRLATELDPAPADGDPGRLRQVVTNLLANALRYTPPGGAVTIRTWSDRHGAHLEVRDTGPGIAEAERPHVFERFYRGAAAAGTAGSGIGLAVAAELVAAHGGTIEAHNRPGGGAAFLVTIPARR